MGKVTPFSGQINNPTENPFGSVFNSGWFLTEKQRLFFTVLVGNRKVAQWKSTFNYFLRYLLKNNTPSDDHAILKIFNAKRSIDLEILVKT